VYRALDATPVKVAKLVAVHPTVEAFLMERVEAIDERGRPLEALGTTVSRQVFTAYPDMFCWNSLARWDFDGTVGWGEDQDIWHPRKWRAYAGEIGALIQ